MDDGSFLQSIPPVTRIYLAGILGTTIGLKMKWLTFGKIFFSPELIMQGQYWRLISSFFYFGGFGIHFFFNLMFIYRYCKNLEEENYRGKTADFIVFFIFSAVLVLIMAFVINMPLLGMSFTHVFVYVWSRRNSFTLLNIFGFIVRAPYLPFVFMGLSLMLGGSITDDLIGITVGHLYYFLEDVFPHQHGGFKILVTPEFLKRIFNENYVPPVVETNTNNVNNGENGPNRNENQPGGYNFGGDD